MSDGTGPYSRRIGSRVQSAAKNSTRRGSAPRGGRIYALRLLPAVFAFPALVALTSGQPIKLVALVGGIVLLIVAGMLVRRGLDATAEYETRRFARPPLPYRLTGALACGVAFLLISWFGTSYGLLMGLVLAGLGAFACLVTYGMDPSTAKTPDRSIAEKAGVKPEQVAAAVIEAEAKLEEIKDDAATLSNREIRGRLDRIVDNAHAVLDEIERDPKDLPRARRFLNTYLDGTRNVVRDYARRQQDFADTPLSNNFKNVLTTIEQVFEEQIAHLKRDEVLDLEVAIDVLNTQLTKEGVG